MALNIPVTWRDGAEHRRMLAGGINGLIDGRSNNAGTFTVTASAATTAVSDPRAGTDSVIVWMPTTANAAAAISGMYVSARGNGTFTITHANNAQTDRDFVYAIIATSNST